MSSTGHAIRDPFFDRSHRLIAQLLRVQRQRRQGCAPGTSSPGQGFQNPRRNGGLRIRESIHQIVKFFSGTYLHGSNLAHPSRPDPMVPAGKRRPENRQTTSAQRSACEKRRQPNGIDRQLLDSPFRSPRPVTRSSSSTGALSAVTAAHRCHRSRSPAQWRGSAARRPERRRKGPAPCRRSLRTVLPAIRRREFRGPAGRDAGVKPPPGELAGVPFPAAPCSAGPGLQPRMGAGA